MEFQSDVYSSPKTQPYVLLAEAKPKVVRVMQMKKTRPKKPQEEKKKNHKCKHCARLFHRKPDMNRHISSVHDKMKPFKCPWPGCNSAFNQKTALENHKNIHTGEKVWACGTCGEPFGEPSSCARHQREQHTGLTHFCPYCASTNKRASEFQNHLLARHNVERGSVDTSLYKFSEIISLEALGEMPQFKQLGMNGIAIRRSQPPPRARGTAANAIEPVVVISGVEHDGTPFYETSQTPSSYQTTPASTLSSLSPSPSFRDLKEEGYSPQASPYVHGHANALGMEFGQGPYSNLHPISRTSSAASVLSDSQLPTLDRPSSAPGFANGCCTPNFPPVHGGMEQKVFNPHTTAGSSYLDHSGLQYYPTSQMVQAPYAYHNQPMVDAECVQSRQQAHHYLPGGLGISHTIRSRAHLRPWSLA